MLERVLVEQRLGLARAQDRQLPRAELDALLDEVEVAQWFAAEGSSARSLMFAASALRWTRSSDKTRARSSIP